MATLLLELFSEEIPSRMQRGAAEQLQRLVTAGLEKNLLKPESCRTFVSPRHLAIQCFGLPDVQPDMREERKGPKVGAPEQAMKGFLGATGLALEQCEQRDGYYYATIERKGQATATVVKHVAEEALAAFSWPKSMRWGNRPLAWVRPLHRITCMLDAAVVPVAFAHLEAGNVTEGHRFLAPQAMTLTHAQAYEATLAEAKVVADYAARRARIAEGIAALAAAASLSVVPDEALLDEVTGLVEWPVPLLGEFDAKFLSLPPEVLISEMKVHQRYFALQDATGTLTNRFIAVANMVTEDGGKRVVAGNARVLRARLSDGEFYWEQDKKTSLGDWGAKLADVVFHAKVGMMDQKVARIEQLALAIAGNVGFAETSLVQQAARLCKADLTSGMVGEFPELQGIMGRYYAHAQGEDAAVAEAIYEHYKPQGAGDSLPETPLGAIISLADKLDSIISLFAAGEKPTGSKDPLALRRAALGVLRILLERGWDIDLGTLANGEVLDFFRDRLRNLLKDSGVRPALIDVALSSASAMQANSFRPVRVARLPVLLGQWMETAHGAAALGAIKRAMNILAAEGKKAKETYVYSAAAVSGLALPVEAQLRDDVFNAWMFIEQHAQEKPQECFAKLDTLAAPTNAFFDAVLVTETEFRTARLSLLAGVRDCALQIADFSKIEA